MSPSELKNNKKKPVVVLRSNDVCFTGVIRSLGVAGVDVIPVVFTWDGAPTWYSERSQFFKNPVVIPNPFTHLKEAKDAFVVLGKKLQREWGDKIMVLPSSDVNLMFLLDHFDEFKPYFYFMGGKDLSRNLIDIVAKDRCFEILEDKVNIPVTKRVKRGDDLEFALKLMPFPCVVKPSEKDYGQSFYRRNNGFKAVEFSTCEDCIHFIKKEFEFSDKLIVQEKVLFDSAYDEIPYYLYRDGAGKLRMAVGAVKEKIQPFPFGTATVLRLTHNEELMRIAQTVADAIDWRGFLMIEFIKDMKDNQWKVIEINPRPWLFIDFFRRAGFPFIQYWYEDFYGGLENRKELVHPQYSSKETSTLHYSLTPIMSEQAKVGRVTIDWIKQMIESYTGNKSFTYLDPSDLVPGEDELKNLSSLFGLDHQEFKIAISSYAKF